MGAVSFVGFGALLWGGLRLAGRADWRYATYMADRDVERAQSAQAFAATLRRLADAVERGEAFRIQVADARFTVPADAELSIEHEVEGDTEELELQLRWKR